MAPGERFPGSDRARTLGLALLAWVALACAAGTLPERERPVLRVGTSGDYPPFSEARGSGFEGFDLDVARAYARDRGLALRMVRFRWGELLGDLASNRFDVAMSGITVRSERSLAGRFTVPVVRSGALALVRQELGRRDLASLDHASVRLAVNRGGHLERVARERFPRAQIAALANNADVRRALLSGAADAALTDTLEAPVWLRGTRGLLVVGPFTRDRKAYLLRTDQARRAADLDDWLIDREADGTLARLRRQHLGAAQGPRTARVLPALLDAIDERLDLMPWVAEAKRATGAPIRVPEREARVVTAAQESVAAAARRLGRVAPDAAAVAALFRAQMAAAREIQAWVLARPPASPPAPELAELRAALLRIGERMAALLVRLPAAIPAAPLRALAAEHLEAPGLTDAARHRIADALAALTAAGEG